MGNNQQSRRQFFSFLSTQKKEKVKMLTPDGKLVEVDKRVLEQASQNKKATNQEIYDWMENPSKKADNQ